MENDSFYKYILSQIKNRRNDWERLDAETKKSFNITIDSDQFVLSRIVDFLDTAFKIKINGKKMDDEMRHLTLEVLIGAFHKDKWNANPDIQKEYNSDWDELLTDGVVEFFSDPMFQMKPR
jgi:hypothetical protein